MIFFDTNLFLYAASQAPEDRANRGIASQLIADTEYVISTQVLQEFIAASLSKKRLGISETDLEETIDLLTHGAVVQISPPMVRHALTLRRRYQISYWDAAILTAAAEAGCQTLYTEDLNHGQIYGSVKVINPFLNIP
jgi:predicted nucleic acid-binding protein